MSDPLKITGETPLDPQDPLPEGKWFWRRLIVFALLAGLYVLLWRLVQRVPTEDLLTLCNNLLQLIGVILVLYLVAPSAQQIVDALAHLRLRLNTLSETIRRPAPDCDDEDGRGRTRGGDGRGWRAPWERDQ